MKKPYFLSFLLIIVFALSNLVLVTACTATNKEESTGQYIDSSTITLKVKSQLLADDVMKNYTISVSTYKGVVQLSGFVDTEDQKQKALDIARKVDGVKSVVNALVVKNP